MNQVMRMRMLGCDISIRGVTKFDIVDDENEMSYIISSRPMRDEVYSAKNKRGRKPITAKFDELTIYENMDNFNAYHPNLNDIDLEDPLDIVRQLSASYKLIDDNNNIRAVILFFYFIDLDKVGGSRAEIDSQLCDAILQYVLDEADDADANPDTFYGFDINIITNSDKTSDNIIKRIEPQLNNNQGISMRHIPLRNMLLSARTNVLSPKIREADEETVKQILKELNHNRSVFGTILVNDPLILDCGIPRGRVVEIEKPDGYIYYRLVVDGSLQTEKIG